MKKLNFLASLIVGVMVFSGSQTVYAHVTVKPAEVLTAAYQTFTVNVPNEKDIPTIKVELLMPQNIENITVTNKPDWSVEIKKEGDKVKSVTWSGSEIKDGFRDEFTFSAKTPADESNLEWKAYQTYSDGTVVSWDRANSEEGHSEDNGPFSVTSVSNSLAHTDHDDNPENTKMAERALYVAVASVALGLVAIFIATRRKD